MTGGGAVLEEIRVYPLKGAGALTPERWEVDDFGPALDRRWMVVDPEGRYLTQREHPRLALIRPSFDGGILVLEAPGTGELRLPADSREGPAREVTVWEGRCQAADTGTEAAKWISSYLDRDARIVFMPGETFRPVKEAPSSRVSFADGHPFLLLSLESVEELNRRLDEPVSVDRFRPNLVVRGAGPHDEDAWRRVEIGDLELRVVKPCPRCAVTTVDQETAEKGREPLRTLASYRRHDGKVWFGQNLVHQGPGTLERGQPVRVLEAGPPRPDLEEPPEG